MAVVDIIREDDDRKIHTHDMVLWPSRWQVYNYSGIGTWHTYRLGASERSNIPGQPGIYTLIVKPGIAGHPACSYLMYVGKTSSLRRRFGNYLNEKNRETGRPKIIQLLNKYPDNLWFCFTQLPESELSSAEDALINAFVPPCNDQLPAKLLPGIGAFS